MIILPTGERMASLARRVKTRIDPSVGVASSAGILAAIVAAGLWSVAARRPSRDDLFSSAEPRAAQPRVGRSVFEVADDPGQPIWKDQRAEICSLEFSPDDRLIAAWIQTKEDWSHPYDRSTGDMRLVLIEIDSKRVVWEIRRHCSPVVSLFTPKGDAIAVPSRGIVSLYDVATGALIREISVRDAKDHLAVAAIGFSRDGLRLACMKSSQTPESCFALEIATGEPVPYEPGEYIWRGGGISPNGDMYNLPRSPKFPPLEALSTASTTFASAAGFSCDGNLYAVIYANGLLVVWDIAEMAEKRGRILLTTVGFRNCQGLAISHAENRIACATNDGTIKIAPLNLR